MGCHVEEKLLDASLLEDGALNDERLEPYTGDGSVDLHGYPVLRHNTGKWRACSFILGTECCERLAYYGIATNLVTYLTKFLHESNASAARNISTWQGTCYLTPLLGGVLADAYWGRYWTIALFSTIYFIGMAALTLSASVAAFKPPSCIGSVCPSPSPFQYAFFHCGLYLIALGAGGIKPCVSSFGADQFDDTNPMERVKKCSFFNWFYFSISVGSLVSSSLIVWIQDNAGWGLGFGIPTVFMVLAIGSFLAGTVIYRFQKPGRNPLTRTCQVVVASVRKLNIKVPDDSSLLFEVPDNNSAIQGSRKLEHTDEFKFFDKAATISDFDAKTGNLSDPWKLCSVTQVEELKILFRVFPIWATLNALPVVYCQIFTTFVEQGMTLDTSLGSLSIPPASLSVFVMISVIFLVPIYDRVFVPIARKFTGNERGLSEFQRMGIGLFISLFALAAAALVEIRRLEIARDNDLVYNTSTPIPMSILWQIPQYFFVGAAEMFTFIGQTEFFYDQSPDALRSLYSAFSLLTSTVGSYLNSFILSIVIAVTTKGGSPGWIPNNLNEGHLDYFFWLLAGLSLLNLVVYVACAGRYKSKKAA
ncbi:hypothetical protein AMTRI_Chr04g181130 [Amborella trichopoda]|uniref:Major facilitator superfamily (MFS) profile domain-containing protein n=1 Tax=Amborella trichopoda TaxID=13333 RepID=W1PTR8_AMBTC|nr:protein NRT1/ PTR FAMILY 8.3 isoform X2 [Amborella trichopoda]ERN11101.1 hypothetical protein AMTR_s00024p00148850 [Amborella trichopoda]|eukprot:XP_006849520.1 protein NRT1/ PTR FAMILY 8.3 isoform X2 [Amborella trichopoda]